MDKVNPFPALTAPYPLILLSNLFIAFKTAFEAILLYNLGNLAIVKGTPYFNISILPNLSNQRPKVHQIKLF